MTQTLPTNNFPERRFLILVATTTLEKIAEFNAIARLLDFPLVFVSFKEIMDFHSPDEEKGNRVEHARDKSLALAGSLELLINSSRHNKSLRKLCAQHNVPYDPQNIRAVTEDASLGLIEKIWKENKDHFAEYLPPDVIANAEKDILNHTGEVFRGPGSEIGPVISAMTVPGFIRAARGGEEEGKPIKAMNASTLVVSRLDGSLTGQKKILTSFSPTQILGGDNAVERTPERWLDSTTRHLNLQETPHQSQAADYTHYLKHESYRTEIVRGLYDYLCTFSYTPPKNESAKKALKALATTITSRKSFCVRTMSGDLPKLGSFKIKKIKPPSSKETSPYLDVLDLSCNFTKKSDAYLFFPINAEDKKLLRRTGYVFFSTLVEKMLEAESMNKHILAINDGSLNSLIDTHCYLVNAGMTKDFDLIKEFEPDGRLPLNSETYKDQNVAHKGFSLFDVVYPLNDHITVDSAKLHEAGKVVLKKRHLTYRPSVAVPLPERTGATEACSSQRKDLFKVAFFTSAGNDNFPLLENNWALCYGLKALKNVGVVWGGGDRHGMGEIWNACKLASIYIEGYSTPAILTSETRHSAMPQCDYSEISPNIFIRMARMIEESNVITITPGGIGTLQEMLAVFVLMDENPELMKDKTIIIHNQTLHGDTPFWNPIIERFLGKEILQELTDNHHSSTMPNLHMTTEIGEHAELVTNIYHKWDYDRQSAAIPTKRSAYLEQNRCAA